MSAGFCGDLLRNEKLARLRAVVTRSCAVLAFDLAGDKQVCALTDPDSQVLARRTVKAKAWALEEAVAWGLARAAGLGFTSVVVACEPTGYRWRVLGQIAARARLVCVQPLLVHRARESEDLTRNKNDEADAAHTEPMTCGQSLVQPSWARLPPSNRRSTPCLEPTPWPPVDGDIGNGLSEAPPVPRLAARLGQA